jgi:hypothetical protein
MRFGPQICSQRAQLRSHSAAQSIYVQEHVSVCCGLNDFAGHVDPEAPLLNGYIRPDVIHRLLLRDGLAWAVGKIGQNIQCPIPEGKHSTVAPKHPLANRKFKKGPNLSYL